MGHFVYMLMRKVYQMYYEYVLLVVVMHYDMDMLLYFK